MARENRKQTEKNHSTLMNNRRIRSVFRQLSNIVGSANLNLYGTDRTSDVDSLNQTFQNLMKNELTSVVGKDSDDTSSFLSKLNSQERKATAMEDIISRQFSSVSGEKGSPLESFIQEAYKNRLVEQADLHEVASQLIELGEAILITRDAIVSADVVEGRMSRTLNFENADKEDLNDYIPLVEHMEKKFKLLEKIKNFIIPKALEYGEYYAYTIPYSKIFNDFVKSYSGKLSRQSMYKESTLLEYVNDNYDGTSNIFMESSENKITLQSKKKVSFGEKLYTEFCEEINERNRGKNPSNYEEQMKDLGMDIFETAPDKDAFISDIENMMGNISVCNDPVPLPIIEEGFDSLKHLCDEYVNESGTEILTEAEHSTIKTKKNKSTPSNHFEEILKEVTPDGITYQNDRKRGKIDLEKGEFDDFSDCYIKLISPTKMIPVKIMSKTIGYYYVQEYDIAPLNGAISSNLYYSKFDERCREQTIIDSLAKSIVDSFGKEFLKENAKFKETIVEALQYYNLNEKRIKFQYIPIEYVQEFKIDEDEDENGQSMIKKSLFYAKLYLMLLLFKIMSIILNSNDTKVNYIKTSGIDKNISNKVQEIARIKQSRQINMYDLFNYTTLVNKVGSGNEMYVPTGRSGERPIETEILSGQDVQLNTELLENLKNSYILGTGVPAAIINYMSEADFAKVIEQNNTKFNGRVVNYQLDFNSSITDWYKKIMRWSTQIPENLIENFTFTLQSPKTTASQAKSEAINGFQTYAEFVVNLLYGDNADGAIPPEEIQEFKKLLADDQLPMLNIQKLNELMKEAKLNAEKRKLEPKAINGDSGDDLGLDID